MFSRNDAIDLLSVVTAYDNRRPSEATVLAWREAGERGRWTLADAVEAVHGHFVESREWIMPADVTKRVRVIRTERAARDAERAELERGRSVDTPSRDRVMKIVSQIASKLGMPVDPDHDEARRTIECPHCGSTIGQRCQNPQTGKPLRESAGHEARIEAMIAARSRSKPAG